MLNIGIVYYIERIFLIRIEEREIEMRWSTVEVKISVLIEINCSFLKIFKIGNV